MTLSSLSLSLPKITINLEACTHELKISMGPVPWPFGGVGREGRREKHHIWFDSGDGDGEERVEPVYHIWSDSGGSDGGGG